MLTGADERVALELVMKAKKALIDSGSLIKDFCTARRSQVQASIIPLPSHVLFNGTILQD